MKLIYRLLLYAVVKFASVMLYVVGRKLTELQQIEKSQIAHTITYLENLNEQDLK